MLCHIGPSIKEVKMEFEEQRKCLQCGKEFSGRPDKVFCCPECKTRYHNIREARERRCRSRILTAITRNYRILRNLAEAGHTRADMMILQGLGFKPAYVTGHRRLRGSHDEYWCYDICYYKTETRLFNIKRVSELQ